jgi:catechol 2,3-dioxygenase-like lactoylglutathione lyase family enzyme
MLGHLGINVPDLRVAKDYYGAVLPLVGFEPFLDADDEFAYRPAGGKPGTYLFFYPAAESAEYSRHQTGLQHLAFMVRTRSAVHDVHALITELAPQFGGQVLHEPRVFPQYPQPYFATLWLDPWGFMLEAVCHYDQD